MHPYLFYFRCFELVLFILPVLHPCFYFRLTLGLLYFISHLLKVHIYYARFKYYILNDCVNRQDDPIDYNYYFNLTPLLKGNDSSTKITSEIVTDCLDNKKEVLENIEPTISKSTSEICGDDDSSDSFDSSDNIVM